MLSRRSFFKTLAAVIGVGGGVMATVQTWQNTPQSTLPQTPEVPEEYQGLTMADAARITAANTAALLQTPTQTTNHPNSPPTQKVYPVTYAQAEDLFTFNMIAGVVWRVKNLFVEIQTSATVANRDIILQLYATNYSTPFIAQFAAPIQIPASYGTFINWSPLGSTTSLTDASSDAVWQTIGIPELILDQEWINQFSIEINNMETGDSIITSTLVVEEFQKVTGAQ